MIGRVMGVVVRCVRGADVWLVRTGQSCCAGRSQEALRRAVKQRR